MSFFGSLLGGITEGLPGMILGAAGSLITGGANAAYQSGMSEDDRKWQEKMYQRQLEDSRQSWLMQQEYNSPINQMQRLSSAGLNPHLVYGNGATAMASTMPVTPSSSPAYRHGGSMFNFDLLGPYLQTMKIDKEIQVMNQQINESKSREDNNNANTAATNWQTSFNKATENALKQNKVYEGMMKEFQFRVYQKYGAAEAQARLNQLNEGTRKITEEIASIIVARGLTANQAMVALKDLDVKDAMVLQLMSQCGVNEQMAEKLYSDVVLNSLSGIIKETQFELQPFGNSTSGNILNLIFHRVNDTDLGTALKSFSNKLNRIPTRSRKVVFGGTGRVSGMPVKNWKKFKK